MGYTQRVAGALVAACLLAAAPARANTSDDAEKLRRLDIMLMVTGLRCRTTADNFQPDYQRFTTNHITTLNAAARRLEGQMSARLGPEAAKRALDRMSVTMANTYGQGHPWLGCAELRQVAQSLARAQGPTVLVEAADQLLANGSAPRGTRVRR